MISDQDLLVLDTNVLVYLGRRGPVAEWMERTWRLVSRPRRCVVSRVSHAEIAVFVTVNGWGDRKQAILGKLLDAVITVEITAPGVQDAYVALDVASRQHKPNAITMGKHDLWIAATAKAVNGVLVSHDVGFTHLTPAHVRLETYDPRTIIDEAGSGA